ncbi:hypothetical protein BGX24_004420 [Mortierella sp. AD032]|nr:hypothetical protein BGX24_004420 [Mortierella sp. AD032]
MPSDPILPRTGFILPELLELIGNHLGPSDLFACVQACRLWNQHLIPQLWRTIDDGLYSWPMILQRITLNAASRGGADSIHWLLDVFAKHGRHIRHLTADWALTIATTTTTGTVTRLESLAVRDAGRHRGFDSVTSFLSLFDELQLSPLPGVAPAILAPG